MKCPICGKPVERGGPYVPFCGDRCRLLDLGNWASEKYGIPASSQPGAEPDNEEEDPREQR
jgi:endogenous inhibitor of DNA gyrase (YacG/DUF329 family)